MAQSRPQGVKSATKTTTAQNPNPGSMSTSMLDEYLVKDQDLRVPELCYRVSVDFTTKPKDDPRVDDIKSLVVALGNSYGGVITLAAVKRVDDLTQDAWDMKFWEQMEAFLPESFITNGMKLEKEDQDTFHLLVKRSPELLTKSYGLHTRKDSANRVVKNVRTADMIMKSAPSAPRPPRLPKCELACGAVTSLIECEHTDFKFWETCDTDVIIERLQNNRTQNGIFAMANLPTGGAIYVGIQEDKKQKVCKVVGQILDETKEETLTKAIESLMNQEPSGEKRVWGTEGTVAKQNTHWAVEYLSLTGCPSGVRRVVIKLELKHCPGGMFRTKPESFRISPKNEVERLDFNSWKLNLQKSARNLEPVMSSVKSHKRKHLTLAEVAYKRRATPGVTVTNIPSTAPATQTASPVTYTVPETVDRLSWSEHADWEQYNTVQDLAVDHHDAIDEVINLRSSVTFSPDEAAITSAISREETLIKKAIQEVKQDLGSAKAFVVASTRLSGEFLPSSTRPSDHMVDFLSLDDSCCIRLWATYSDIGSQQQTKQEHLMALGRSLKKELMESKLLQEVSVGDAVSALFVKPKLSPSAGITADFLFNLCSEYFKPQSGQLDTIKQAMGLLLCRQNAAFHIKQASDEKKLIQLSFNQMAQILGFDVSKFNLIEGPPGSGKTLLALYLCQHVFGVEHSVVLCTNPCLAAYYSDQGIDSIRVTNLKEQLKINVLKNNTCLILDDCQNLECDQDTLEHLYCLVQLKREAHLFMLFDNSVQNFNGTQNVVRIRKSFENLEQFCGYSYMRKQLNVVQRNSQRVTSYIASSSPKQTIICGHNLQGDDVEIRRLPRLREQGPDNDIVKLVKDLVAVPTGDIRGRYVPEDIAIAVDGLSGQTDKNLYTKLFEIHAKFIPVQGAEVFPRTGLTIDHLDHFCGLDSKVFILVAPDIMSSFSETSGSSNRSITNPKYRAFVASRGIDRVIFVTGSPLSPENVAVMRSEGSKLSSLSSQPSPGAGLTPTPTSPDLTAPTATLVTRIKLEGTVRDLDFGPNGRLLVTSGPVSNNERGIIVFEKCHLQTYDTSGNPAVSPIPDSHANVTCVSCLSNRVVVYDQATRFVYTYRVTGHGQTWSRQTVTTGQAAAHLAVTPDGRMICVRDDSLWCLGKDGQEVWRRTLQTSKHEYDPYVAADADSIVVTNTNTNRVTLYDHSGNLTASLPTDRLGRPFGACLMSGGRILVINSELSRGEVLMFTKTGDFLGVLVTDVGWPRCVSVWEDKYLAVGTWEDGVFLYSLT